MTKKIAIYGAGNFGKLFRKCLGKVDFFIDDLSTEKNIEGIPIVDLSDIPQETKIYISPLQYSTKIEHFLRQRGFENIINFTESIKTLPNILEEIAKTNYLWLNESTKDVDEKKIEKVKNLLVDEKSKTILNNIVNLRKTFNTKYYINPEDIEYFPQDVPVLENLSRVNFIDCGAYTGDTIEELINQKKDIGYTISFEPDSKNLLALQKTLSKFTKNNHIVYPAGVYSSNTTLHFANNGIDSSAAFDENSSSMVSVVALDTIILNSHPNFIKMDIEGAEKEALLGARKILQKYKPNLAICLYHKTKDLWELPLLIAELEPSYKMYIRVHEDLCLSTVLYCISKER